MKNSFVITPFLDFPNGEALCAVEEFEQETASVRKYGCSKKELYFQNKENICYAAISVHEGKILSCRFLSGEVPDEWYPVFFENLEFFRQNQNVVITPDIFQEIPVLCAMNGRFYRREEIKNDLMVFDQNNFIFRISQDVSEKSKFLFYTSGSIYPYALATIKGNVLTNYNLLPPKKQEDLTVEHLKILSKFCQTKNVRLSENMLKNLAVAQDREKNLFFTTELPGDRFFDEVFFTKEPVAMSYCLHAKKVVMEGIPVHKMPVFMPETETLELRRVTKLESLLTAMPNLRQLKLIKVPLKHIEPDIFVRAKQGKIRLLARKCPALCYPIEPKLLKTQWASSSQEKEE